MYKLDDEAKRKPRGNEGRVQDPYPILPVPVWVDCRSQLPFEPLTFQEILSVLTLRHTAGHVLLLTPPQKKKEEESAKYTRVEIITP